MSNTETGPLLQELSAILTDPEFDTLQLLTAGALPSSESNSKFSQSLGHSLIDLPRTHEKRTSNIPLIGNNYRHIYCISCLDYEVGLGEPAYSLLRPPPNFPNEPTMTREQLNTLQDGKSLHSSVMSCMLTLFQWHYSPPQIPEQFLFVHYSFLEQLVLGTRTIRSLHKQFFALSTADSTAILKKCTY